VIDRGVHGIVVNGSTGEFASMSDGEKRRNLEAVLEVAGGRVPVTAQVGGMTTAESVASAGHAKAAGADAALLVSPYYEPLDEEEIEYHFRAVADVGLPIMIYNNPAATGWSMSPELVERLAGIDEVRFIKDTTPDAGRVFRIRQLVGDRIQVLSGQDSLAIVGFLAGGATATVWGAANAIPEGCVRLWELTVARPQPEAARRLWSAIYPLARFFETNGYVQSVKTATRLRGMPVGPCRKPALPLGQAREQELTELLANVTSALRQVEPVRVAV
jgi:4-hydroxy-tetrahydrodipicolinate synthase